MKILVLYNRLPIPLNDGGNLAVHSILKGLKEAGHYVHLLAMNTHRHWVEEEQISSTLNWLDGITTIFVDNRLKPKDAFVNLIKNKSYHLSRFINKSFEDGLISLLKKEKFDIVQLEGLYVTPYINVISKFSNAAIIYRQHNIEYKIWQHAATETSNFFKGRYLKLLSKQLEKYEIELLKRIQYILPISKDEAMENVNLGFKGMQKWMPFGVDVPELTNFSITNITKIYHIGAMDWLPNEQGMDWFINSVWGKVIQKLPNATFYFAGRNMPERFLSYQGPSIFCMGTVDDANLFESDKGILVVPLQTAAGIRIKTLKALVQGKLVVSTSIGAKGLDLENGKQILISDDAQGFADRIVRLVQDQKLAESLSFNGQEWVRKHYDNTVIIDNLTDFYKEILKYQNGN